MRVPLSGAGEGGERGGAGRYGEGQFGACMGVSGQQNGGMGRERGEGRKGSKKGMGG